MIGFGNVQEQLSCGEQMLNWGLYVRKTVELDEAEDLIASYIEP